MQQFFLKKTRFISLREPRPDWSPLGVNIKILDEHPHLFLYIESPPRVCGFTAQLVEHLSNPVEALNIFSGFFSPVA